MTNPSQPFKTPAERMAWVWKQARIIGVVLLVMSYYWYRSCTRNLGNEPLYNAIEQGDQEQVADLLGKGSDPNGQRQASPEVGQRRRGYRNADFYYAHTPLTWALAKRQYAIARQLIDHGADVHRPGPLPPIEQALADEDSAAIGLLLDHGVSVNERTRKGVALLFAAAGQTSTAALQGLLKRGANPNVADPTGMAMDYGKTHVWSSVEQPAGPPPEAWVGVTPLMVAARGTNPEAVRLLLDHGASVNARTRRGQTALMLAAEQGRLPTIRLLLSRGADARLRDGQGRRAGDYTEYWLAENYAVLSRLLPSTRR